MNVCFTERICNECGLLWTCSVENVSAMNVVENVSAMNVVIYEHGLYLFCFELVVFNVLCFKHGLLWTGLLWMWSIVTVVCCERVL